MSPKVLWDVVRAAAARADIDKLAPHDLRRTCARLCHLAGGELDQIQFLLGHVSIQTTERYLGCKQKLRIAVNDRLGIEPMLLNQDHRQGGCFNPPWATRQELWPDTSARPPPGQSPARRLYDHRRQSTRFRRRQRALTRVPCPDYI
jgi:Phage integrase family